MGLLTILKKMKHKEREMRLLMLYLFIELNSIQMFIFRYVYFTPMLFLNVCSFYKVYIISLLYSRLTITRVGARLV